MNEKNKKGGALQECKVIQQRADQWCKDNGYPIQRRKYWEKESGHTTEFMKKFKNES